MWEADSRKHNDLRLMVLNVHSFLFLTCDISEMNTDVPNVKATAFTAPPA